MGFNVRNLWYRDSALWIYSWIGITPHFVPSTSAHQWLTPTAVAGAIFYGLAGANHLLTKNRNRLQNVAMLSDLFASSILCAYCLAVVAR